MPKENIRFHVNSIDWLSDDTGLIILQLKNCFIPPVNPEYQLRIEGNNLLSISVKCYRDVNDDEYILNSRLNPDIYFTSKKKGIFEKNLKPGIISDREIWMNHVYIF